LVPFSPFTLTSYGIHLIAWSLHITTVDLEITGRAIERGVLKAQTKPKIRFVLDLLNGFHGSYIFHWEYFGAGRGWYINLR